MVDVDAKDLARIALTARYWFAHSRRMRGVDFTEAQWTRMRTLAQSVDAAAVARFLLIQLAGFCLCCVVAGTSIILLAFRVPAHALSGPVVLLGGVALIIAVQASISRLMRPLWASERTLAGLVAEPDDAELIRKFTRYMRRIWFIASGTAMIIAALSMVALPYIRNSWIDQWLTMGSILFAAVVFLPVLIRMFCGGREVATSQS